MWVGCGGEGLRKEAWPLAMSFPLCLLELVSAREGPARKSQSWMLDPSRKKTQQNHPSSWPACPLDLCKASLAYPEPVTHQPLLWPLPGCCDTHHPLPPPVWPQSSHPHGLPCGPHMATSHFVPTEDLRTKFEELLIWAGARGNNLIKCTKQGSPHTQWVPLKSWISNTVTKASCWRNSATGCPLRPPNSPICLRGGQRGEWKWRVGLISQVSIWHPGAQLTGDPTCREDSFHPAWNTKRRVPTVFPLGSPVDITLCKLLPGREHQHWKWRSSCTAA